MPGQMGFFKVKNNHLVIKIVSDENGIVSYTYPLKPMDKSIHTAEKKDIFVPIGDLAGYGQLKLS